MNSMKSKLYIAFGLASILMVLKPQFHFAYHNFFFRQAGDITGGQFNNGLIDSSSVTKKGPTIDQGELEVNSVRGENINTGTVNSSHVVAGIFLRDSPGVLRSSHTAGKQKYYQITIGTTGSNPDSADILDNGITGFTSALVLGQLNGLTLQKPTTTASIFLNPNSNFNFNGATLPAGVVLVCGDSTTISPVGVSSSIIDVYGQIGRLGQPCTIDLHDRGFTGEMIRLRSNSRAYLKFINASEGNQASGMAEVMIRKSTNVVAVLDFESLSPGVQDDRFGALAVNNSSDVYVTMNITTMTLGTVGKQIVEISSSGNIHISGTWNKVGGRGVIIMGGNQEVFVENLYAEIAAPWDVRGFINFQAEFSNANSTSTHIINNTFFVTSTQDSGEIIGVANSNFPTRSVYIEGNRGFYMAGGAANFIEVESTAIQTVIKNNYVRGFNALVLDSGIATIITDNILNGVIVP